MKREVGRKEEGRERGKVCLPIWKHRDASKNASNIDNVNGNYISTSEHIEIMDNILY